MNPKLWWGVRHIRYEIHHFFFWRKWGHYTNYIADGGLRRIKVDGKIVVPDEYIFDLDKIDDMRQGRR